MKNMALALIGLVLICVASEASAQSPGNAHQAWSGVYTSPSANDQALANNQALLAYQLAHGVINPGGSSTVNNTYNGTVDNTYTGPNSNSGSSVNNIGNLNSTSTVTTATGSKVTIGTTTTQSANGATQSGAASANATTLGSGVINGNDLISTVH